MPAAPSSGASCACWNSARKPRFFGRGKGPLLKKGRPSPCTPIPPKTFTWVRDLPRVRPAGHRTVSVPSVAVLLPASLLPLLSGLPCRGVLLTGCSDVLAQHLRAFSSCVKPLLPWPAMPERPSHPFPAWLPRVRAYRTDAAGPHAAEDRQIVGLSARIVRHAGWRDPLPRLLSALLTVRSKAPCPAHSFDVQQFSQYISICYFYKIFFSAKNEKIA